MIPPVGPFDPNFFSALEATRIDTPKLPHKYLQWKQDIFAHAPLFEHQDHVFIPFANRTAFWAYQELYDQSMKEIEKIKNSLVLQEKGVLIQIINKFLSQIRTLEPEFQLQIYKLQDLIDPFLELVPQVTMPIGLYTSVVDRIEGLEDRLKFLKTSLTEKQKTLSVNLETLKRIRNYPNSVMLNPFSEENPFQTSTSEEKETVRNFYDIYQRLLIWHLSYLEQFQAAVNTTLSLINLPRQWTASNILKIRSN